MDKDQMLAVHGEWVVTVVDDELKVLHDHWVIIDADKIHSIKKQPPAGTIKHKIPKALVLPGLINSHNHGASSVMFRGLTEDWAAESFETELIYGLLMPLGDLALRTLNPEQMQHVVELALLEIIKGGSTTLMEIFRPRQSGTFEAAANMGLRFYGAPYLFSADDMNVDESGTPTYQSRVHEESDLDIFHRLHAAYNGASDDRIRVAIGPHGLDSCSPELLRQVRSVADELGVLINVHVCQTRAEVDLLQQRYGQTPTQYMESVGLLGHDVLAAHCLHASDDDLRMLSESDTTIVNCPMTFARGGVTAAFERFRQAGARTVIGTDGYYMDIVSELRSAGLISKLSAHDSGVGTAEQLLKAVTIDAAKALGRTDIGRLTPGAKADLVVISLDKPHFQPVSDPLKTYVWNARGAEIELMLVDGEILIRNGKFVRHNESGIIERGTTAIQIVWEAAAQAGIRHVPAAQATPGSTSVAADT